MLQSPLTIFQRKWKHAMQQFFTSDKENYCISTLQVKGERDYDGRIFDDPGHSFLDKIIEQLTFHEHGQYPMKLQYDPMVSTTMVYLVLYTLSMSSNCKSSLNGR